MRTIFIRTKIICFSSAFKLKAYSDNNIDFKFTSAQIPDSDYENIVKPL